MKRNLLLFILGLIFTVRAHAVYYAAADLSVEEKVGQLLMVHFRGESGTLSESRLDEAVERILALKNRRLANGLFFP